MTTKPPHILDYLNTRLTTLRDALVASHIWLVSGDHTVLATSADAPPDLDKVHRTALKSSTHFDPEHGPTQLCHGGRTISIQRLERRYHTLSLLVESAGANQPGPDSLTTAARNIERAFSRWLAPREQDRLRRRSATGDMLGSAFSRLSSAVRVVELLDPHGFTVTSWPTIPVTDVAMDVTGAQAAYALRVADQCATIAALGPLSELTWYNGRRARVIMRLGEHTGVLVLDVTDADRLPAIQAMVDLLVPGRHQQASRAWLRVQGCSDPQRTAWQPEQETLAGGRLLCSRHGRLFHRTTCTRVAGVETANRRWLSSRVAGLEAGLRPCKTCGS